MILRDVWRTHRLLILGFFVLLAHGSGAQIEALYPESAYEVRHVWREAVGDASVGMVEGYHIQPRQGAPAFDVYLLGGQVFSADEAALAFGIAPKDWSPGNRSAPATRVVAREEKAERPRPVSASSPRPPNSIALAPPSLPVEDTDAAKGPLQIGAVLALPDPLEVSGEVVSHGAWLPLPDGGRYWAVQIDAPGALGQRLEITALILPQGARLIVYRADNPDEAYGPFASIPPGDGSLWTPTCFGESLVVECVVPAGAGLQEVRIAASQTTYRYRNFADVALEKQAGTCNRDVSCFPDWATAALGVGGLGTVTRDGEMLCTFALVADNDPCTDANYVLTANHCFGGAGVPNASSAEFYWFYQTDTCGGTPPSSPAAVPRTAGGADLLANMGGRALPPFGVPGNDFMLLKMRNDPPPGTVKLGWSTEVLPIGTEITCIHHPRADYKRISFGNLSEQNNPQSAYFWETTWYAGTTQGGSSGSPLFRTDRQEIIGQLWGGLAACANAEEGNTEPDYYGRFDVTYPLAKPWLDPDPLVVGFQSAALEVAEGAGSFVVQVIVGRPAPEGGLTLRYEVQGAEALPGLDYRAESGLLFIAEGESTGNIVVEVLDDELREEPETFSMALTESGCAEIDSATRITVLTILDDDPAHSADTDGDGVISEPELLLVVALFESGDYHCDGAAASGYAPGSGDQTCIPHAADYAPTDWRIGLSELLRVVQIFNAGGYTNCAEGEDGYCVP